MQTVSFSTNEALRRRSRGDELAKRMSVLVGGTRVFFSLTFVFLSSWQFRSLPHRWIFWGYLLASLIVWGMIYLDIWRKQPRSVVIGIIDAAVLTYLVHMIGSFSFLALGYAVQGLLFAIAVGPRVALAVTGSGTAAYAALVFAESAGWSTHAPYAPAWLSHPHDAPALTVGLGACVIAAVAVATLSAMRLARQVELERELSDGLLLNILPASIAERLKSSPRPIAERFEDVTVLFADLSGFTQMSSQLPPERVVEVLNDAFSRFDALATRYGLEKIKTIGDAYMAAAGVPLPTGRHVEAAAAMAFGMLDVVSSLPGPSGHSLQARVGIHCGPVVAGVIGVQKLSYDVWGDTVNIASRMESHGQPGRVHVSAAAAQRLSELYELEPRGTVEIKGKGAMETFFLLPPSATAAGAGPAITPA